MSQTSSSRMSDIHESPEDYVASQEVDTAVLLQELVESLQTLHFSDEMTPEVELQSDASLPFGKPWTTIYKFLQAE